MYDLCFLFFDIIAFYKYLVVKRKLLDVNPVIDIETPKKKKQLPKYLSLDESLSLLDTIKTDKQSKNAVRDYAIITLFLNCGMRLSELTGLALDDVDCKQSQVRVTGKRNKQRVIPFGSEMMSSIHSYLPMRHAMLMEKGIESNWFFVSEKSGGRMPDSKVRQIVQAYLGQVTTLRKKSPHVLRHSFATSMLNHRADLQSVKELLGHERLSTTEIYTHTTFEELKDMYNQAHPRAPKK